MFETNKVVRAHNKYSKQLSFPVRILKRTPKQFIFTDFISGEYKARLVNDKWMYKETELFDDMDTFDFKKEIELELLEKTRNEKINKLMQKNTPFFAFNIEIKK